MSTSSKDALRCFIEKAKIKHGDKYDYDETEYINSKEKIKIYFPLRCHFLHGSQMKKPILLQ